MSVDCSLKRGQFIGKLNSLRQEFYYVSPQVYVKILNLYATSFYGSYIWNLFSKECKRIYISWNIAMRVCYDLNRTTHRYLIESVTGALHPFSIVTSFLSNFWLDFLKKIREQYLGRHCRK